MGCRVGRWVYVTSWGSPREHQVRVVLREHRQFSWDCTSFAAASIYCLARHISKRLGGAENFSEYQPGLLILGKKFNLLYSGRRVVVGCELLDGLASKVLG
ncbi:unnamed protein product [Orchesella dallaii]|uniref:Uncharacterized protein n=1 Tax=Orchesella dallaii TaxID=48710 RepID=A0ABP1Q7Y0_9HEXA